MVVIALLQKMGSSIVSEMSTIGKAGALAEEAILGVRTVQSMNGQPEMVARYHPTLLRIIEQLAKPSSKKDSRG